MKTTNFKEIFSRIQKKEEALKANPNMIEVSIKMVKFLQEILQQLKDDVLQNGFTSELEEINFFKKIKPLILGKLVYYNEVYKSETDCPATSGKLYQQYYSDKLETLSNEYKKKSFDSDFYRYYRAGRTDKDDEYFRLGHIDAINGISSYVFEIDTHFSTGYDSKVARIISFDLLHGYLLTKIETDDCTVYDIKDGTQNNFYWSGSASELIELIYALYAAGCISKGNVEISKIAAKFQTLFGINLGEFYHAFHRMKDRAGSQTIFLDNLKSSMNNYMNKMAA